MKKLSIKNSLRYKDYEKSMGINMDEIIFSAVGEQGIAVLFEQKISEETNGKIRFLMEKLRKRKEIREMIPAFCSLLVFYDCRKISYSRMKRILEKEAAGLLAVKSGQKKIHIIPVCYGDTFGEDIGYVSEYTGLKEEEIIRLHCGRDYLIYMLGFLPGFAYLGGLDERIFCPRLESPRTRIMAGSIGIGGEQTGIYPLDSPGGWRLIGKTPLRPYDVHRNPPILYKMGDYIRFQPVTSDEYDEISAKVEQGIYKHRCITQ